MNTYTVPLRVSLTGGGLDIPDRIADRVGFSIAATINKYVYVSVGNSNVDPPFVKPASDLIDALVAGSEYNNLQISWRCDVSLGTGLGASSALLLGVAKHLSRDPIAEVNKIELARGAGYQDAAICGNPGCRVLSYTQDGYSIKESLPLPDSEYFMLVYSNKIHDTSKQHSNRERYSEFYMERLNGIVTESKGALRNKEYNTLGEMINEVHYLKSCNPKYALPETEDYLSAAKKRGAYGGKLCGSGGGGYYLLVIDPAKREVLNEVSDKYGYESVPFTFTD